MHIEKDDVVVVAELRRLGIFKQMNNPVGPYAVMQWDDDNIFLRFRGYDNPADNGWMWVQFDESDSPERRQRVRERYKSNMIAEWDHVPVMSKKPLISGAIIVCIMAVTMILLINLIRAML